jgi:hypothetical protein
LHTDSAKDFTSSAVTSRSRLAESRQKQSSVSESVSRSLAEEQAKAAVQRRKRCDAAEEKQLEAERKLADAQRLIAELQGGLKEGTEEKRRLANGESTERGRGVLGSAETGAGTSGGTEGSRSGIDGKGNETGKENELTEVRGEEKVAIGLSNGNACNGKRAEVGPSRLRPSSAHPKLRIPLQVPVPKDEEERNGRAQENQADGVSETKGLEEVSSRTPCFLTCQNLSFVRINQPINA